MYLLKNAGKNKHGYKQEITQSSPEQFLTQTVKCKKPKQGAEHEIQTPYAADDLIRFYEDMAVPESFWQHVAGILPRKGKGSYQGAEPETA